MPPAPPPAFGRHPPSATHRKRGQVPSRLRRHPRSPCPLSVRAAPVPGHGEAQPLPPAPPSISGTLPAAVPLDQRTEYIIGESTEPPASAISAKVSVAGRREVAGLSLASSPRRRAWCGWPCVCRVAEGEGGRSLAVAVSGDKTCPTTLCHGGTRRGTIPLLIVAPKANDSACGFADPHQRFIQVKSSAPNANHAALYIRFNAFSNLRPSGKSIRFYTLIFSDRTIVFKGGRHRLPVLSPPCGRHR